MTFGSRSATLTIALTAVALTSACSPSQFLWDEAKTNDIAIYRESFLAATGTRFVASTSRREFVRDTTTARVLWLGDHHVSHHLHELQNELLAELQASGRPLVLALEAIGEQDDRLVAAHLRGDMDALTLRGRIRTRWPGSWLDDEALDCAFFCALVAFGKRHAIPVHGLEPTPRLPLDQRDALIATRVQRLAARYPEHLIVVVVGQAHLLGYGALIARCAVPSQALGGEPPEHLVAPAEGSRRNQLLRSDGGLWWFAELLPERR